MNFLNEQVDGDIHLECNSEIARLQELLEQAEEQLAITNTRLAAIDAQEPAAWINDANETLTKDNVDSYIEEDGKVHPNWIPLIKKPKL